MRFDLQTILMSGAAVAAVMAAPMQAQAAENVQRFDIAAQDAAGGLNDWARQAGVEVVFPYAAVEGQRTPAVQGVLTRSQALRRLIGALPVAVSSDAGGVVTLASPQGDAASSSDDEAVALDEIVVTAQKFEERLRDVPISISAVTGDQLLRQGATRLADFAGYIPGLQFSAGGGAGNGEINLRGVTTSSSPSASTAVYIDEVPTTTHGTWGSNGYRQADLFPYDLERVEVLRGPQGTLYGDSTIGGLVKYVTRTANVNDFSAAAGVEALAVSGGDGVGGGARAMVNLPIAPGVLGVRLSGFYQKTPGYVSNAVTGEEGVNEIRQRGLRLAARLTPTDAFSVDAQWIHTELEGDGRAYTRIAPGTTTPVYGGYTDSFATDQPTTHDFDLLAATARYDFGPVNLTSVTGYSKSMRDDVTDLTDFYGSFIPLLTGGAVTDGSAIGYAPITNEKFTQELRLASAQDQRVTWLVGAYYSVEDTDTYQRIVPYDGAGAEITDLIEFYLDEVQTRYTDLSAFANLTFKITDKWEISGGVRHSRIEDVFHEKGSGLLLSGSTTVPYYDDIKTKNESTTWSLSTRYIANDDLMMFARAASGFRAGGINYTWPGADKDYDPDSLVSYEAGVRADFLNDKASIDLTVYYLDWTDLFIIAFTPPPIEFGYQTNGGQATGAGMEFTGTLRPIRGLTLTATAAYFGLKLREDVPSLGGVSGDRTPDSPAWSGSLSANYTMPLSGDWELNLGGGLRMASHTYSRFIHDPAAMEIPSYVLLDLNAGISNDRWTLRGYVKNLTDEDAFTSIVSSTRGVQRTPRTLGLALDVKF